MADVTKATELRICVVMRGSERLDLLNTKDRLYRSLGEIANEVGADLVGINLTTVDSLPDPEQGFYESDADWGGE